MAWYDELNRIGTALGGIRQGLGQGADTYYDILNTGMDYNERADTYDAAKQADLFNLQAMLQAEQARTNREAQLMRQMQNQMYLDQGYRDRIAEATNRFGFGSQEYLNDIINYAGGRGNALAAMDQQPRLKEQIDRNTDLRENEQNQKLIEDFLTSSLRANDRSVQEVYRDDDGTYVVLYGEPDENGEYEAANLANVPGGKNLLMFLQSGKTAEEVAAAAFKAKVEGEKVAGARDDKDRNFQLKQAQLQAKINESIVKANLRSVNDFMRASQKVDDAINSLRRTTGGTAEERAKREERIAQLMLFKQTLDSRAALTQAGSDPLNTGVVSHNLGRTLAGSK